MGSVENLKSNLQISHGATCKVYRNNIEITNQSVVQNGDIVKIVAENEGRKLHAVLDEAFQDYLNKKSHSAPRREVMQALASSMQEFDLLYEALAK